MNSLNFDYDTLSMAIKMWDILSLFSKKTKNVQIPERLLKINYSEKGLYCLLTHLFKLTLTKESNIELNEDNCKIADVLLSADDDVYNDVSECIEDCPEYGNCVKYKEIEGGCHNCKNYNKILHNNYNFYKISLRSSFFEDNKYLNEYTLEMISRLYFFGYYSVASVYIGHVYNKDKNTLEILYFSDWGGHDDEFLIYYPLDDVLDFFKNTLNDL